MRLLTSNLFPLLILSLPLIFFSSFRIWLIRPIWKMLVPGALLLTLAIAGAIAAAFGTPGGEATTNETARLKRLPPVNTHLQRLQAPWDSELVADWPVAETLATISEVAYLPPVDADPAYRLLGFKDIVPVVANSMIGYVVSTDDVTVIAFRGTDFPEVSDWMANLGRTPFETEHGTIHKGFYKAYQSLQPQIMTVLRTRTSKHLWITGHSLGGALALVCAYDMIDFQGKQIDGLITFGQPMVVRRNLANHMERVLAGKFAHFVNNSDVVPRVPPSFEHCGSLVWFSGDLIKRSKSSRVVVYGAVGDAPQVEAPAVVDEPPPLTDAQFEVLQQEARAKQSERMNEEVPILPRNPNDPPVAMGASPLVDDHSMMLYVQRVRELLGITPTP
jgi:triacylglycerol lipase